MQKRAPCACEDTLPAGLLSLSTLEGNIILLQDCANAAAGHSAASAGRFPSHFPKLRERKMKQFPIFSSQLSLLLGGVPQASPGELTPLFQFCSCHIWPTTLHPVPSTRSQHEKNIFVDSVLLQESLPWGTGSVFHVP